MINIAVSGGKLLGLYSGDPVAHVDPASKKMKAFNGMLMAIVQSNDHPWEIRVNIRSEGLKTTSTSIRKE